jgi:hypothetical protein
MSESNSRIRENAAVGGVSSTPQVEKTLGPCSCARVSPGRRTGKVAQVLSTLRIITERIDKIVIYIRGQHDLLE